MSLLGYKETDIQVMMNAIHDSKLYYLRTNNLQQDDESSTVNGLLDAIDFFYGLLEEGHFDD